MSLYMKQSRVGRAPEVIRLSVIWIRACTTTWEPPYSDIISRLSLDRFGSDTASFTTDCGSRMREHGFDTAGEIDPLTDEDGRGV